MSKLYSSESAVDHVTSSGDLLAFSTSSTLKLFRFAHGLIEFLAEFAINSPVNCLQVYSNFSVLCAHLDGSLVLYSVKKEPLIIVNASENILNGLDMHDNLVAVVGDDNLLHIFDLNSNSISSLGLQSRALAVKFHKRYAAHLMVAEVESIALFDVISMNCLLTVSVSSPIVSFDWHQENPSIFGALGANGRYWLW